MTKSHDYEGDILALGWDTESAGGSGETRYRATQGGFSTPWCANWQEVLEAIKPVSKKGF